MSTQNVVLALRSCEPKKAVDDFSKNRQKLIKIASNAQSSLKNRHQNRAIQQTQPKLMACHAASIPIQSIS